MSAALRVHRTVLLGLCVTASCSGTIGGSPAPSSNESEKVSGGGGRGGSGGNGGPTGSGMATGGAGSTTNGGTGAATGVGIGNTATCPSNEVPRTPLRRLTRFEYANTVKQLLGIDPSPVADLPVDEVTDGFSNNAGVLTVSPLHAEKYVLVSEALAKAAIAAAGTGLSKLTGCDAAAKGEDACAADFARRFGRRAFRRPTTADDERILMAMYSAGRMGGSYAEGIEVIIRAALQSPHFLYRLETTTPPDASTKLVPLSQFELATRLSFLIWGAGPDDALLDAAARGELGTRAAVATKARAMLQDPKARVAVTEFYKQWIGTSRLDVTSKSATLFPAYSPAARDAMARELPAFVEHVIWTGDRKLSTLLTSPMAFVSGPLASIYGVTVSGGAANTTPQMVMLPDSQGRSGILTQAAFLSVQAHPDQTSPVLRGKFVRTKLMCQPPDPPPPDADITPPDVSEAPTARQRASAHLTAGASCFGCHQLMDPIGLAFENFDAIGQYRTMENGMKIDVSGSILGPMDPALAGAFTGVRELGAKLAASDQVRDCVATQWFRFATGRAETNGDACSLGTLQETFSTKGGDLAELVVGMTETDAFWYRPAVTP